MNCLNTRRTPGRPNLKLGTIPGATRRKAGSCTTNCAALPNNRGPRYGHHQTGMRAMRAVHEQRADYHCHSTQAAPCTRQKELPVRVENAEAPRGENEHASARKENSHERRRERILGRCRARRRSQRRTTPEESVAKGATTLTERAPPPARIPTSCGAARTPPRTMTEATSASALKTAPASSAASRFSPRASVPAYSGMKDAESTPSPNRFCSMFGMRNAPWKASFASDAPR